MDQIFADLAAVDGLNFDAGAYRAAGHVFVALKATEGVHFRDPRHRGFALAAGLHHIGTAHYHFGRPDLGNTAEAEAAFFLENALPLAGPRDYLVLDLERFLGSIARDPAWSRAFDAYVRAHSRFKTVLYGSRSWLEAAPADQWLAAPPFRFWDADWSAGRDFAPAGGVCVMRQSSDGTFGPDPHELAGVGRCDVNHLRGGFAAKVLSKA